MITEYNFAGRHFTRPVLTVTTRAEGIFVQVTDKRNAEHWVQLSIPLVDLVEMLAMCRAVLPAAVSERPAAERPAAELPAADALASAHYPPSAELPARPSAELPELPARPSAELPARPSPELPAPPWKLTD